MQRAAAMSEGAPTLLAKLVRDQRGDDARADELAFDPLFAATLVNHIAPAETVYVTGYPPAKGVRPGIAFDLKA
ncbi:MAG TPA: hypothetical protein PKY87_15375 [Terricaulis sp.]|nr:hypothetical protein [Terricaulis sp.]